jgi:predicted permease
MNRVRVPALPQWLLARRIDPSDRPMVLGDLDEQFQAQAEVVGPLRARLWYWQEALLLSWGLWWWAPRTSWIRGRVMAMDDARYAVRRLRKQPLATVASIATLACAIGAAAATWSLISVVLLHPLRIHEPETLYEVGFRAPFRDTTQYQSGFTYPMATAIRDAGIMDLAFWGSIGARTPLLVKTQGEARPRGIYFASAQFLDVLGVAPAAGRFFNEAEDVPGGPMVAVLSHRLWQSEFNGESAVVGSTILVRDQPTLVVGVLPRSFRGLEVGRSPDMVMPIHTIERVHTWEGLFGNRPALHWVSLVGRLPEGATPSQVAGRLNTLGLAWQSAGDHTFELVDVETASLSAESRQDLRKFSTLLGGTVALMLAIGSLTVGMLLLLRTEARGGEFAMCLALGASRARLATGVVLEGVLLAVAGTILAIPVSRLAFVGMSQFRLPGGIRMEMLDLSVDSTVLVGTAAASVACVLLIGGLASLFALRQHHGDVLRAHAGATPRVTRRRSRAALVTAQVAVTLVLVSGAGLFASSVMRALSLNPGIDTSRLLWGEVDPIAQGYSAERSRLFVDDLKTRLLAHPAIAAVGISESNQGIGRVLVNGQEQSLGGQFMGLVAIDDSYLATVGLRVLAGRSFTDRDGVGAPPVAIVSESLARAVAGTGPAVGLRIGVDPKVSPMKEAEIVGVVPNIRTPGSLEAKVLYLPNRQYQVRVYPGSGGPDMVIRPTGRSAAAIVAVTETIHSLDPGVRPAPMTTLDERIMVTMAPQRFGMTLMGALGTIALLLSVLGTYVIAESMATLRRREMGIRAALGATGGQLGSILLVDTLRLVGAGLVLGFGLSWLGAETIRAFLFQVEPFDPVVTGVVSLLIIAMALAVSLRPALAAARLDLATVLRED